MRIEQSLVSPTALSKPRSTYSRHGRFRPKVARRSAVASVPRKPFIYENEWYTKQDIMNAAERRGLEIEIGEFGPFFKGTCKLKGGQIVGDTTGFITPITNIAHFENMRIYNSILRKEKNSKARSPFGIGVLLGCLAVRHVYDKGSRKAELLAIYDSEDYARKLVSYYTRIGFKTIKQVEGGAGDIMDMIVWGGTGTLMEASVEDLLEKWTPTFVSQSRRYKTSSGQEESLQ